MQVWPVGAGLAR